MSDPTIPQYHELMEPVLVALQGLGRSGSVGEIYERVVADEGFSTEQQVVVTKDGRMSEIEYRLHWARTHLKGIEVVENPSRGMWSITDKGRSITPEQIHAETSAWRSDVRRRGQAPVPVLAVDDQEIERRRRKFAQIALAQEADAERVAELHQVGRTGRPVRLKRWNCSTDSIVTATWRHSRRTLVSGRSAPASPPLAG